MSGAREDDPEGFWPFGWEAAAPPAPAPPPARPTRRRLAAPAGSSRLSRTIVRSERPAPAGPWWRRTPVHAAVRLHDLALLLLATVVTVLVVLALS